MLNPRQALGVWFSIAPFTPRFWGEERLSGHQPDTAFPVRCCCDVFRLAVLVRIKLWFRYRLTDGRPSDKVGGPGERDLGPRGNVLAPPQPREAECVACRSVRVGRLAPRASTVLSVLAHGRPAGVKRSDFSPKLRVPIRVLSTEGRVDMTQVARFGLTAPGARAVPAGLGTLASRESWLREASAPGRPAP